MIQIATIRGILQMNLVPFLATHLRAPIDLLGYKHSNFQFIIDKVVAKVNSLSISQSQKLILINTILIAIAARVLSCMEVPISIASRVDSSLDKILRANKNHFRHAPGQ